MKRICLWGTSLRKVADEAQFLSVIQAIRTRSPDVEITIFSIAGQDMPRLQPEVTVTRTLHLHRVIPALASSDLFVIVGGPFFEAPWQALICLVLFSLAKLLRCPMVTYGSTIFPMHTHWGRRFYRWLLNRMDAISVREPISKERLQTLGVTKPIALFADPRFLLDPTPQTLVHEILRQEGVALDQPLIGITTRYIHQNIPRWVKYSLSYSDAHVDNANEVLARVVSHLSETAQILIIPMHPHFADDEVMAHQLRRRVADPSQVKMLSRRYSSPVVLGIIAQCDLLLAGRLGSAVFATVTGTPLVTVSYEDRTLDYMERVGLGSQSFDWKTLRYEESVRVIDHVLAHSQEIKARMHEQAQALKALAWRNAEFLHQYLENDTATPRQSEVPIQQ